MPSLFDPARPRMAESRPCNMDMHGKALNAFALPRITAYNGAWSMTFYLPYPGTRDVYAAYDMSFDPPDAAALLAELLLDPELFYETRLGYRYYPGSESIPKQEISLEDLGL